MILGMVTARVVFGGSRAEKRQLYENGIGRRWIAAAGTVPAEWNC